RGIALRHCHTDQSLADFVPLGAHTNLKLTQNGCEGRPAKSDRQLCLLANRAIYMGSRCVDHPSPCRHHHLYARPVELAASVERALCPFIATSRGTLVNFAIATFVPY